MFVIQCKIVVMDTWQLIYRVPYKRTFTLSDTAPVSLTAVVGSSNSTDSQNKHLELIAQLIAGDERVRRGHV